MLASEQPTAKHNDYKQNPKKYSSNYSHPQV